MRFQRRSALWVLLAAGLLAPQVCWGWQASPAEKESSNTFAIDFQDPLAIMREGGLLMWPILLCSVVTFTFALERWVSLRRGRILPRRFLREFFTDLQNGRLTRESAIDRCHLNRSPAAMVILPAVRRWGRPMTEIEQAVTDGGMREVVTLKRNLRVLHGSANIATLLGLLGTVLGMILAFNQMALAGGEPRTEMLAGGIAQALLTTAFGLAVAIPSLFLHGYFTSRVEKLVYELDQVALAVAERISQERITGPAQGIDAPPPETTPPDPHARPSPAGRQRPKAS